ncbi:hypothetical protein Hanom_Chr03g00213351 [Helianthus anomalus]
MRMKCQKKKSNLKQHLSISFTSFFSILYFAGPVLISQYVGTTYTHSSDRIKRMIISGEQ